MISTLTGSAAAWATFAAIVAAAFTALGIWFKHGPDRKRAINEAEQLKITEAEKIRTDYAAQIKEFRLEVHGYRNELHLIAARLATSEATSARRGDKLSMMAFIVRLVLDELRRLNPDNTVIKQAETLLDQLEKPDTKDGKSDGLAAVHRTVEAAQEAERVVKASEAKK